MIITLKSGAELELNYASFKSASKLMRAIASEIKSVGIDAGLELDIKKAFQGGQVNMIKDLAMSLLSSEAIEAAIMECAQKSLYNKQKINHDLFELDVKAREDYLEVMWEVAKFNVFPFLKNLTLRLGIKSG